MGNKKSFGKLHPECEKLSALENEHRAIVEFEEFLSEQGYLICESGADEIEGYLPVSKSLQTMFYEMYGIDPVKLEAERQQILEDVREANNKK